MGRRRRSRRSRRYFLRGTFLASFSLLGSCTGGAIARKVSNLKSFDSLDSGFDMMTGALLGLVIGAVIASFFVFKLRSHTLIKGTLWATIGFVGILSFLIATKTEQPEYQVREEEEQVEFLGLPVNPDDPAFKVPVPTTTPGSEGTPPSTAPP